MATKKSWGKARERFLIREGSRDIFDTLISQNSNETLEKNRQKCREFLEMVLKTKLPDDIDEALTDGVILCNLLETGFEVKIPKVYHGKLKFKTVENIRLFLQACSTLNVPNNFLFQPFELSEKKDMRRVYDCILSLQRMYNSRRSSVVLSPRGELKLPQIFPTKDQAQDNVLAQVEVKATPRGETKSETKSATQPETIPSLTPVQPEGKSTTSDSKHTHEPEDKPTSEPDFKPVPKPEVNRTPEPEVKQTPEPEPEVKRTPEPEVKRTSEPEVKPTPEPEVKPTSEPEVKPTPEPEVKPTPEPEVKHTPQPEETEPETKPQLAADTSSEPDSGPTQQNGSSEIEDDGQVSSGQTWERDSSIYDYDFIWQAKEEVQGRVYVIGTFSHWEVPFEMEKKPSEPTDTHMTYCATVPLQAGEYEYKFLVSQKWEYSPSQPIVFDGSIVNNYLHLYTEQQKASLRLVTFTWKESGSDHLENIYVIGTFSNWWAKFPLNFVSVTNGERVYSTELLVTPGEHQFKFIRNGQWVLAPGLEVVSDAQFINHYLFVE